MSTSQPTPLDATGIRQFFFEQAEVELKRAERYRVFVSLVVLDISAVGELNEGERTLVAGEVENLVKSGIRGCDYFSICGRGCLVALFPETSRQGAETAGRRLGEKIRSKISELTQRRIDEVVPLEMASYPDAAGAQSVSALLHDLAHRSRN
jgi:GGDEF domain-containing protein